MKAEKPKWVIKFPSQNLNVLNYFEENAPLNFMHCKLIN